MGPVVVVAFLAASLWNRGTTPAGRRPWRLATIALLMAVANATVAMGSVGEHLGEMEVSRGVTEVVERIAEIQQSLAYDNSARAPGDHVDGIVDYLAACTAPRARLFAMTFAPQLFLYTRRGFAAGHESLVPGFYTSDRAVTEMLERLSHEDVPFVIMDTETSHQIRANYPRLIAHVDGRYREVARFPMAAGKDFIVLADATRARRGSFGRQALPCFAAPDGIRPVASR